jgi:hypothetical protein
MDFVALKKQALEFKGKADKKALELLDASGKHLAASRLTIKNKAWVDALIALSKNTTFTDPETGKEKSFEKKSMIVFADPKTKFFNDALYMFPVLWAKWFSKNTPLRLATSNITWVDLSQYKVTATPSLVIFKNTTVDAVITWEEKIAKLVKTLNLDINEDIENMS